MPKKFSIEKLPLLGKATEENSLRSEAKPFRLVFDRSDGKLLERTSELSLAEQRLADWTQETLVNLQGTSAFANKSNDSYIAIAGWMRFDNDKFPFVLLGQIESLVQKQLAQAIDHGQEGLVASLDNDFGEIGIAVFVGASPDDIDSRISLFKADADLAALSETLDRIHEPVNRKFQAILDGLVGKTFGSVAANRAVAAEVQQLLNRLGLRVRCPREGCGEPARLSWRDIPRMKDGCLQFEHTVGGRHTSHGGSATWPKLKLVPAPPDPRRKTW